VSISGPASPLYELTIDPSSKLHTERLHKSSKPVQRRPTHAQTLTDTEDDDSGAMDGDISTDMDSSGSLPDDSDSDEEKEYEMHPRKNRVHEKEEERNKNLVARLPIKLPDGTVKRMGERRIENESDFPSSEGEQPEPQPHPIVDDVTTGARFGRMAVIDVLRIEPRDARVYAAKEQLASICQDIVADPETNVSSLTNNVDDGCVHSRMCSSVY
jgi:nucleolar complex protein 3